jgi:RHS repeat-associated protein
VFDASGNRIAEYDQNSGLLLREYVWNGLTPVAVIEGGAVYFIRTDHIGKPVFATDSLGTKVWQVSYDPFGGVVASTGTPANIRFPGQWFQSESGLHPNWMRDYDPTTGRYLQADPLGLVAGVSVYGYARQNSNKFIDHNGEFPWVIPVVIFGLGLLLDVLSDEDGCIEPAEWLFYIFRNLPPLRPVKPFMKFGDGGVGGGGRGSNRLKPDPNATGDHTTFGRDANDNVTAYETWTPNPKNPTGFDTVKRVDT